MYPEAVQGWRRCRDRLGRQKTTAAAAGRSDTDSASASRQEVRRGTKTAQRRGSGAAATAGGAARVRPPSDALSRRPGGSRYIATVIAVTWSVMGLIGARDSRDGIP